MLELRLCRRTLRLIVLRCEYVPGLKLELRTLKFSRYESTKLAAAGGRALGRSLVMMRPALVEWCHVLSSLMC